MSLESVLLEYGAFEVSAMDVYSDIFQLGYGFIQTEGEPSGEHKANPIIVGSFGGHYDEDGKLEGDRVRRRILFEDTFEPWDVRYDPDRAKELLETGLREYDRLPDGRPYDGRPWWQA